MPDPCENIRTIGLSLTKPQKLLLTYVRWRATQPEREWKLFHKEPRLATEMKMDLADPYWQNTIIRLVEIKLVVYYGKSYVRYLIPTPLSDLLEEMGIITPWEWEQEQGDKT